MRTESSLLKINVRYLTWMIATATAIMSTGCQRGMYNASSLPMELVARPAIDVRTLDLSRLASATANSQLIGPGDTLNMTVVTGAEERQPDAWPLRVNEDGTVQVPLVGPVQLAGLDLQSAQNVVRTTGINRGIYKNPSVSIGVEQRQTNRVTVLGAVAEPGTYDLDSASSNLLAAISAAGGLGDNSSQIIELRQPREAGVTITPVSETITPANEPTPAHEPQGDLASNGSDIQKVAKTVFASAAATDAVQVDLVAATLAPATSSFPLRDGAVVMVRPQKPRYVHVMGLVNRPDQFEIPPSKNIRVLDAIALAGGRSVTIADRVFVIRQTPGGQAQVPIEVSVTRAKSDPSENLLLTDGDVVSVEETAATLVLGMFQQFIRVGVNGTAAIF